MKFFEKHDLFFRTSVVGNWPDRLNARYTAIIDDNRTALQGASILDIASHDGRWSFAALSAGAHHVHGVEVRPELVTSANKNLATLGIDPSHYRFTEADIFSQRLTLEDRYDVILCLGFLYHTTRHVELFERLSRLGAKTIIVDTMLSNLPGDATILRSEPSDHPANGLDETGVQNDRILVAHPTAGAVKMILEHFGYDVSQTDWQKIISSHDIATGSDRQQSANNPVGDYAHGLRGTFVGTRRI